MMIQEREMHELGTDLPKEFHVQKKLTHFLSVQR